MPPGQVIVSASSGTGMIFDRIAFVRQRWLSVMVPGLISGVVQHNNTCNKQNEQNSRHKRDF